MESISGSSAIEAFDQQNWQEAAEKLEPIVRYLFTTADEQLQVPKNIDKAITFYGSRYCVVLTKLGRVSEAIAVFDQYRVRYLTRIALARRLKHDVGEAEYAYLRAFREASNLYTGAKNPDVYTKIRAGSLQSLAFALKGLEGSPDGQRYLALQTELYSLIKKEPYSTQFSYVMNSDEYNQPEDSPFYDQDAYNLLESKWTELGEILRKYAPAAQQQPSIVDEFEAACNEMRACARDLKSNFLAADEVVIRTSTEAISKTSTLLAAPGEQTLVYLLPSKFGLTSIIVYPASYNVAPVVLDLPDADEEFLQKTSTTLHCAARQQFRAGPLQSVSAKNESILITVLHQLWKRVVESIVTELKSKQVSSAVFLPSGAATNLPLHSAMSDERLAGPFANELVSFSYAPSARLLSYAKDICRNTTDGMMGEDGKKRADLVGISNPQPTSLPPLPFAVAELNIIAARFYEDYGSYWISPAVRTGSHATRFSAPKLLTGEYHQIAHFACHAKYDGEDPFNSGIVLAGNEVFSLSDIMRSEANTRLTVLSCCESGLFGANSPNEALGLPTGLIAAGHAGVLATMWPVYDLSSAVLIVRFYHEWLDKQHAPVDALAAAQKWLVRSSRSEIIDFFGDSETDKYEAITPQATFKEIKKNYQFIRRRLKSLWLFSAHIRKPVHWSGHYLTGV